jgi:tripartite-type tricarboxylate transporter receptor subunit TctC
MGQLTPKRSRRRSCPTSPTTRRATSCRSSSVGHLAQRARGEHVGGREERAELQALAKSKPGKLTYASSGAGSLQHLAAELFKARAGVDIVHVPFKGSSQAVTDLIAGHVDMNFDSIPAVMQHVKSGKLRAIAVTAGQARVGAARRSHHRRERLSRLRPHHVVGDLRPAGTPPDVVAKIHRDTLAALQNAELRERFAGLSVDPGGGTSREFADLVARRSPSTTGREAARIKAE